MSGSCRVPQRSPWSALFPPPPPPRPTRSSLFGSFIGTTARSDPSTACMSGVRQSPSRTGPPYCEDTAEVSRFSCMLFLMFVSKACWVLGLRRVRLSLAIVAAADVAFPPQPRGRRPNVRFSKLNHPAHQCLCLRFADRLATANNARLEVRMESLLLSCKALASPTTCRFIPAHS